MCWVLPQLNGDMQMAQPVVAIGIGEFTVDGRPQRFFAAIHNRHLSNDFKKPMASSMPYALTIFAVLPISLRL
jgi:hypothetical protein